MASRTINSPRNRAAPQCRIGTSGFHYKHWRGIYYPEKMPAARWFSHYAAEFDTVELNNTFYRLPPPERFEGWRAAAPDGFCFAVKFSRYGSHMMKLKNPGGTIERFIERAERLGRHLGPILVQLPPRWDINTARLEEFLEAAPRRLRWAFEFRDARWLTAAVYQALRRRSAALCIHDMIADHPREITADWTYLRFHGGRYDGNYDDARLRGVAGQIEAHLEAGIDVYAYFNNDLHGHAVRNAATLKAWLSGKAIGAPSALS